MEYVLATTEEVEAHFIMPTMRLSNFIIAHHRNGITGDPFDVCTFTWMDGRRRREMVAVLFAEPGQCAILDMAETLNGNIGFAQGNSWRGDHFEPQLRKVIADFHKNEDADRGPA